MRLSYADIFQHNTSYQAHGYLFCSMLGVFKVESEWFCRRDGTRIVSRENSFALKQAWETSWLTVNFLWLCWSRAGARNIECIWERFTSWISLQAFKMFWISSKNHWCRTWRIAYPEVLAQKFIILDHRNNSGIEISQCFSYLVIVS